MSGTGSPSDRTDTSNADSQGGAPAGAPADVAVAAAGSGDANSSASPSSGDGENKGAISDPKPTLAEVIRKAVAEPDKGASPDPAKKDPADPADAPVADGEADTAKKDVKPDDAKLPFHNHPRWKEVTGENKTLKAQLETLTPNAEQFEKISGFMDEHHLSHDEVGDGFILMAMMKAGDPRALQKLDEYRDMMATALGEKLPDALRQRVETGEMTEASALELSRANAKTAKTTADADALRARTDTDNRTRDAATRSASYQSAVATWEQSIKASDPDFAKKEKAVERYARALLVERGQPKTPDEAVQIVKDAYAEVNATFAANRPVKLPASHVPSAPSSTGANQRPSSSREAVRLALGS